MSANEAPGATLVVIPSLDSRGQTLPSPEAPAVAVAFTKVVGLPEDPQPGTELTVDLTAALNYTPPGVTVLARITDSLTTVKLDIELLAALDADPNVYLLEVK